MGYNEKKAQDYKGVDYYRELCVEELCILEHTENNL